MNLAFLEKSILNVVNDWYQNLDQVEEQDYINYEFSSNKFRNLYLKKTGEFLKITKRVETICFKKICFGLSQNYEVDEKLLDEYLDWCFDNYDYFVKNFRQFSLSSCANFASEWNKDFLKFNFNDKITLGDLNEIDVHKNIYLYFEKYGIPLASTKLAIEKNISRQNTEKLVLSKISSLTDTKENTNKLKNMLRTTVENAPYTSETVFSNYEKDFKKLFVNFSSEPWCPKC
jgi:hypothetical protein